MTTKEKKQPTAASRAAAGKKRQPRVTAAVKDRPVKKTQRRTQSATGPEVVYTQPGPFNRDRFFLRLLTVIAVVLALLFGMSIFFKVDEDKILISGMQKYTAYDIRQASGIQDGENLLTLRESAISSKIMEKLPYVTRVRVRIKLPDTVNIEIVEADVVYSAEATDGTWWLLRSDGKIVEKTNAADAGQHTKILGIRLNGPAVGSQAVAEEPVDQGGENTPTTVLGSERLKAATDIFAYLEENGIIGDAASVDVSNMGGIELWYADRFKVLLGDSARMDYKISAMKSAIDQMEDFSSGILDVSFTAELEGIKDKVIYTPFE